MGLRLDWLGSERLTWTDLLAIVRHLPDTSAYRREADPDWWVTPEVAFLREISYRSAWLAWVKTKDAKHGRNQPKRIPLTRDEVKKSNPLREEYEPMTTAEANAFLGVDEFGNRIDLQGG